MRHLDPFKPRGSPRGFAIAFGLAGATLLAITAPPLTFAQAAHPARTITHPLAIARHPSAALTNGEADTIIGYGNDVLAQCRAVFARQGSVGSNAAIPSVINSQADLQAACSSSATADDEPTPAGVPRKVRVVNAINWCAEPRANIIGCAPTPGTCMVVQRYTLSLEGILWAHEFGHSKGLPHRENSFDAVMYPSIAPTHLVFTSDECQRVRQLGFMVMDELPVPPWYLSLRSLPIEDFVTQEFYHGVPYEEARQYASADIERIAPWLRDNTKAMHWSNVAVTVGIVADSNAYQVLREFLLSAGSGPLPLPEYQGRVGAIMGLGYLVRGNGSVDARSFLESRTRPDAWSDVHWLAPYHATEDERNTDLAAATILAISLIEDARALAFLRGLDARRLGTGDLTVLERALQQAIDGTEAATFERVTTPSRP